MELKEIFLCCLVAFHANSASSDYLLDEKSQLRLDAKADLARSYFQKEIEKSIINVTHTRLAELQVSSPGENVRIFRSADENFFFTGSDLFQLEKRDSPKSRYVLNAVHDVRLDEGAVFFKNAEWKDKIFLVICYERGYCEIRISALTHAQNLKLRINTGILPLNVEFFATDSEFFMITVLDPVIIYRWTGTYFNEDYRLDTTGAQSVAVIQDGDKFIIVVAQSLGKNKVYSKVFIRQRNNIELFQLLPTHQALRVLPFDLPHGEDVLHYIFILNNVHSSAIFFWTGKEFVFWKELDKIYGQRMVHVGEIDSNTFFFISDQNKLYLYHPTPTDFQLTQIIMFDQNVVGIDVRKEKDQYPMLVVLTGSPMDPFYKVNLLLLKVTVNHLEKFKEKSDGIVWKCLTNLKEELNSRREKINEIYELVIRDGHSNGAIENPLSMTVEKLESLEKTMVELAESVEDMENRMRNLWDKTFEKGRPRKYHVRGDLTINHMEADVIDVEILNEEKPPHFENILSVTKDQTFRGKIDLKTLATNSLITPSINGISVGDVFLRNKDFQRISGDFTLNSLKANDIKFGPSVRLNQIPMTDIVTSENGSEKPIKGLKAFSKLKVNEIEADTINDIPAGEWLSNILPSFKDATEEEPLNFTGLSVEKLWISKLNGIPWEEFLRSIYLPVNNETIKGNLTIGGAAKIKNLKAYKINGIPLFEEPDSKSRSAESNSSCRLDYGAKKIKSLQVDVNPNSGDSFLDEIFNGFEGRFENDVKYFPEDQKLAGDIRTVRVYAKNPIVLSGEEVNPFDLTDRLLMRDEDQVINSTVEFSEDCFIENLSNVKTINKKSLESFLRIDRSNEITSKLIFREAEISGNVSLDSNARQNVNLRPLGGTSGRESGDNRLKGSKIFLGRVQTKRLNANVLNGVDVKDFGNLIREDLENSDKLEVNELIIDGDLIVKNGLELKFLNGVDFNEAISNLLTWDDPEVLNKAHFESLKVDNLQVNKINGMRIEDKLSALSKMPEINMNVIIEGNLKVPSLKVNKINGVDFDDFMSKVFIRNESETQTIRGEKTFKEMVTITGNLEGILNHYNVTELEETALSKTKDQEITGRYTVEEFNANDVEADYVDGIPTDELIFQDESSEQVINSDVVFNNVAIAGNVKAVDFMNGCHLDNIGKIDFNSVVEFENLLVKGPIAWESSNGKPGTLNYFMSNAVSKSEDQVISGDVTFEDDVTVKTVKGSHHLNNVNLSFIAEDAIYKSRKEQKISAPLTFKGPVRVDNIAIENKVLVDTINDVDITDIGQRLVRKNTDTFVTGRKTFKNGFSASHFNADKINGKKTNQIIFYDEVKDNKELFLPPTTFENLVIFNDLTVSRVNGYRLSKIMEERLLKTDESIEGNNIYGNITVKGDVIINGHANIFAINDVNMEDTILASKETTQNVVILGDTEFINGISITDSLQVDYINGENITALYEKALMVDEDAVVEGNIEFLDDVTIEGTINVNGSINRCEMNKITGVEYQEGKNESNLEFQETLKSRMNLLSNLTDNMNKPLVFMYLDKIAQLDVQLPSMHSTCFNEYNDVTEFNIYGMKQAGCGLPDDCYCPTQTNVFIQSLDPPAIRVEPNSMRFFKHFDKKLQVEVTVTTTTVSYSSRCRKNDDEIETEHTSISWRTFEDDETIFELNVETGFLSDVKFFRLGDSIYAVMAFYFHPHKNETNNLHTVVYEIQVNNKTLEKIDEIPSTGVQVLEVFWTMKGVVLVVGNSYDSERFTDSVNSGVYRFNEDKNKFELLRFVKTHGILAIKSMRYKKTSFIFFIQKQTWPLLILKYNQEYDNYYFSQKLDTTRARIRSNFLSLSVISTGSEGYSGDVFIGIVLSDDNFRLFKYKHIEGFVEESHQEQNNVRILHPFSMGSSQYILAGSAMDSSKIYKIVEQGR